MKRDFIAEQALKLLDSVGSDAIRTMAGQSSHGSESVVNMLPDSAFDSSIDLETRKGIVATALSMADRFVPEATETFWAAEARRLVETVGLNFCKTATPEQIMAMAGDSYAIADTRFVATLAKVATQRDSRGRQHT